MPIANYREIVAWQKAHQLTKEVYSITKSFPDDERYGLVPQLRRASVSVPSNITEGFARRGLRDSLNFYTQAYASLKEVDYQLFLSFELGYIPQKDHDDVQRLVDETSRLLYSWMKGHNKT